MDAQRLLGRVGGDAGIAVAVAADPRAPTQERRDARRPRAGAAGVGRLAGAARRRRGTPRRGPRRRPAAGAARPRTASRRRTPGPCGPRRAARARSSQVGRPPQERDLLAQAAPEVAILGRASPGRPAASSSRSRAGARAGAVRRRASVGWAVRTGMIREAADQCTRISPPGRGPSRRLPTSPAIEFVEGTPCRSRSRRRSVRTRSRSSARFTSRKYRLNARDDDLARSEVERRELGDERRRRAPGRRRDGDGSSSGGPVRPDRAARDQPARR